MESASFPTQRLRRMRADDFTRRLQREHSIQASDLIYPIFLVDQKNSKQEISSLPGQFRLGEEELLQTAEKCLQLRIPAIAIFPCIEPHLKSVQADEAFNPKGLIPRRIRALKDRFPDLGIISDIALDTYTSHGQDGVIDDQDNVLNDESLALMAKQALCHAEAGSDILGLSNMMDGTVGFTRQALDENGWLQTKTLAYAAKFASALYGPFRDAVQSAQALGGKDKFSYQLDPANVAEALREVALDVHEGADMVMVKPGLPYLDIVKKVKDKFGLPTFAYQVSGEYAMLKAAAQNGWIDEHAAALEVLLCFKRAGADAILSYYALSLAEKLRS